MEKVGKVMFYKTKRKYIRTSASVLHKIFSWDRNIKFFIEYYVHFKNSLIGLEPFLNIRVLLFHEYFTQVCRK